MMTIAMPIEMPIDSPLYGLIIGTVALVVAIAILRSSAFYQERIAELDRGRAGMIDGLRGWLALAVFFTHVAATRSYYTTGEWGQSDWAFYGVAGQAGVALFFMITGFLFWDRARRGKLAEPRAFYLSRLRRLTPMYAASVVMVLAVVLVLSGFSLGTGVKDLARELRAWMSFGFMQTGDLNGVEDARIINAVYWTLAFEWMFYLSLPLLALFARGRWSLLLFAAALFYGIQTPVVLNFVFGALAAVMLEMKLLPRVMERPALGFVPIAILACVFMFPSAYGLPQATLLFLFFLFVVRGNGLYGLLKAKGSKLLGTVSYSLYLTHCIVLFVVMRAANARVPISIMEAPHYWMLAATAAVLTVALSSVTFRLIEYPFISGNARRSGLVPQEVLKPSRATP